MTGVREVAYEAVVGDGGDMGNMCHKSDMGDMDEYHMCCYNNNHIWYHHHYVIM